MDQSLLAAPHNFSQRATSFVASWCQGIHRMPFCRSIFYSSPRLEMIEQTQTAYPPCTGTIHQKHVVIAFAWIFSKTLGTPFKKPNANKTSKTNISVPASYSMRYPRSSQPQPSHHHASEHSNISAIISSRCYSLPRSDNPSQRTRTNFPPQPFAWPKHQPVHASRRTKTYSP